MWVGDHYLLQKELPVTQPGAFHTGWKTFHLSGIIMSCPSMVTEKYINAVVCPHNTLHDVELHVNKRVCHTGRTLMKVEATV